MTRSEVLGVGLIVLLFLIGCGSHTSQVNAGLNQPPATAQLPTTGEYHTVQQGELLSRIAKASGFRDYRTIWNDPKNADLRRRRHNPHHLFPGDVVWVPPSVSASPLAEQQQPQKSSNSGQGGSFDTTETSPTVANPDDISDQITGSRGKVLAQEPVAEPSRPSTDMIAQPMVSASDVSSVSDHVEASPHETELSAATTPTTVSTTMPTEVSAPTLTTVSAMTLAPTLRPSGSRRLALVIGNSKYENVAPLANPANDAQLMARTLRDLGFVLIGGGPQIDLDKPAFEKALQKFGDEIQRSSGDGSSIALFYYAGHGIQIDGVNYLVPISANPSKPSDAAVQMVSADSTLNEMQDGGAQLKILILDACRNNPFLSVSRGMEGGLAEMDAPKGTLIAYATTPGGVAEDGAGRNSPYTSALARSFREPGLSLWEVFNEADLTVERETNEQQEPWMAESAIEGKFCFAACTK
jgi:hypothetical protein